MKLDAWTASGGAVDPARRKRLTIGYGVGTVTLGAALLFVTYTAKGQVFEQDETIDVSLAAAPSVEAPDPEPEPEPKPQPVQRKERPKSNKRSLATPTAISDSAPAEANPGGGGDHEGDLDDAFDGDSGPGKTVQAPKATVVKKSEPAAVAAPTMVSEREHTKPPVPISQPRPAYPAEAKADGIEDTVVVRFLVTPAGSISEVRVVRGAPSLSSAVVEAVKRWRFEPGTFQGRPVAMWRTASFPFRLKS